MVVARVPYRRKEVNPPESFKELFHAWHYSLAAESFVNDRLRGGVAHQRTRLLDGVPTWQIPALLDRLQEVAL